MLEVPQIHLINLDRSADRLRRFREHNPHIDSFVRFSAVDGARADREALAGSGYISDSLAYGNGTLGCALSHVKLWEYAAKYDKNITVLEDDIVVSHHFYKHVSDIISRLPNNWDYIQWGYILNPLFVWVDLGITKVRLTHYGYRTIDSPDGLKSFQSNDVPRAPLRLLHSLGIQGYSISAKGARLALERILPLRGEPVTFPGAGVTTPDEGIDCALAGMYPIMNAYICVPQIIVHIDHESVRLETDATGVSDAITPVVSRA